MEANPPHDSKPAIPGPRPGYVNWDYQGKTDSLVGTGATQAEKRLVWLAALGSALLVVYFYLTNRHDWAVWQYLVALVIAADLGGGVVANNLNSCKRYYHTPPKASEPVYARWLKNHYIFAALHIYPLLVGLLFGQVDLFYGLFWYAAMLAATLVVLQAPLYLQRPLAMLAILAALVVNFYFVAPVPGFEWLAPALFLKIVYGHIVQEEPYRPADPSRAT